MSRDLWNRPPVGFVVEGFGEYHAFPTLVSKIVGSATTGNIPRVNAGGYGSVVKNLEGHLEDLVRRSHPLRVIVTVDLCDVLKADLGFEDCAAVVTALTTRSRRWLRDFAPAQRLHPLPEEIIVVVQIQKFETWLLSDPDHLSGRYELPSDWPEDPENLDETVPNPATSLQRVTAGQFNSKKPRRVKAFVGGMAPDTMRLWSQSFDKYYREVGRCHDEWTAACRAA